MAERSRRASVGAVKRLLHYTNAQNARLILQDGEIINGLAKAERYGSHRGAVDPQWDDVIDGVIWLTTERAARQAWQVQDWKYRVRFEVEVPDADVIGWFDFAAQAGIPDSYRDMLANRGTKPDTWFIVSGRALGSETWAKITLTEGERAIWRGRDGFDFSRAQAEIELAYEREQKEMLDLVTRGGAWWQ